MRLAPEHWAPPSHVVLDVPTREAVQSATNAVIVAGPGAGKTELLAQRASYLLQTDTCPAPRRILAISFKRDAARNLRERVAVRVGEELSRRLESYTFDAFAKSILDRFGSALPEWCRVPRDYSIGFFKPREWRDFADRSGYGVNGRQLEQGHATLTASPGPLPRTFDEDLLTNKPGLAWWAELGARKPVQLTFGMISTLAMTILAHNPQIAAALRATYSHIFLDEFQDTTHLQYALLKVAFQRSPAIITAVGDSKQRIMTFAGARASVFTDFRDDFRADLIPLTSNFRSNPRIVEIVNTMARSIEPDAIPVVAGRIVDDLPQPTDGYILFPGIEAEAAGLAGLIAREIREKGAKAQDYLLLVRQNAGDIETDLTDAFTRQGLVLRNEARNVDGVAIQDLMTEPLADLVIGIIQMAIDDRTDAPFHRVRNMVGPVLGNQDDRPASEARVEKLIGEAVAVARKAAASATSEIDAHFLMDDILKTVGDRLLPQLSPDYENPEWLETVKAATAAFLQECLNSAATWTAAVAQFQGRDQVRLMTVHKSKGLEADTVFFLHLQNDGFFSSPDLKEEALLFFVAVSRARERLFVTSTNSARGNVAALWDMVEAAGMQDIGAALGVA
ncbi:Superfamily I DNA or RNA helicase [Caulobacter sp. UNC279MFTsu5.1]|nr:Superfamily I DNA or RNA helicase [Caulobacter sp. UNC279MFTsu5.1]